MMTYSTIFKVWAEVEGEGMALRDAISYQFKPYLIPQWEEGPDGAWRRPERLVPLEPFGCQKLEANPEDADFRVTNPIPQAVWSGPPSPELKERYGVMFRPPARLWLGGT